MKSIARDLHGQRFGRLLVLHRAAMHPRFGKRAAWHCRCDCGTFVDVVGKSLVRGLTKSCSCLRDDSSRTRATKHRLIYTRAYHAWSAAKTRCYNPKGTHYADYGGRGIAMADVWRADFRAFYGDMGECPPEHTLERRDNDGPYSAENCYWATRLQQANNKRNNVFLEWNGERLSVSAWTRRLGFKDGTVKRRLYAGWSVERALTAPLR